MRLTQGFSFIEIMVVVAIVSALAAIAVWSLSTMNERLLLRSATSDIGFSLEAAKARAVAGTGGMAHGVNFDGNVYTEFVGSVYDEGDDANVTHEVDDRLLLSTDIIDDEESVVFSRITGAVGEAVTITVSLADEPENFKTIVVGAGGSISYGE